MVAPVFPFVGQNVGADDERATFPLGERLKVLLQVGERVVMTPSNPR